MHKTLSDFTFVVSALVWALTMILVKCGYDLPVTSLDYMNAARVMMTFSVIFFLNQCFSRWQAQYDASMSCEGHRPSPRAPS